MDSEPRPEGSDVTENEDPESTREGLVVKRPEPGTGSGDMTGVAVFPDPSPCCRGKVGIMVGGGSGLVKQGASLVICCVLFGEL